MRYNIVYIQPGTQEQFLFNEVIDHCYPAEKRALVVNQLNTEYLQQLMVLVKDGMACARLAIYQNPYLEPGTWLLGNYACTNDRQDAACILREAENYIREKGGQKIIGPMNGSTWDTYRFSVSGQAELFFTENIHHDWYPQQFIENGFTVHARYFSGKDSVMVCNRPEVLERKKEMEKAGIAFRHIQLDQYEKELRKMHPFILSAFSTNHLYSPISAEGFVQKYLQVEKYMNPEFVLIAENQENETVGIFFCLPDHFNPNEKGIVIKTIARKNDPALKGLGHVMAEIIYASAKQQQVKYTIHAFMHTQGTSVNISQNYSGQPIKQYALYEKNIQK